MPGSLTADEAARLLGITRATLYAYVSRGLLRSEPGGDARRRRYRGEDVEQLLARRELLRNPGHAVTQALHWGTPVLDSSLTLIRDGRLYYRGLDAIELARHHRIEEVASLLWLGRLDVEIPPEQAAVPEPRGQGLRPIEAFAAALPIASAGDLAAHDLRPQAVARTGARILRLLAGIAAGRATGLDPVADVLASAWTGSSAPAPLLDQALILCADHELNVSSFTVRCVASAGSGPYAAVSAGLAALQGFKHGGAVERATDLLRASIDLGPREALASLLRRGEAVIGFGHPLYPDGDPRGRALLAAIRTARPAHPAAAGVEALCQEALSSLGEHPTVDLGLAALALALELPDGAGQALFALGRTVGWVAHAIEEYAADRLIRPRARYTGPAPAGDAG